MKICEVDLDLVHITIKGSQKEVKFIVDSIHTKLMLKYGYFEDYDYPHKELDQDE